MEENSNIVQFNLEKSAYTSCTFNFFSTSFLSFDINIHDLEQSFSRGGRQRTLYFLPLSNLRPEAPLLLHRQELIWEFYFLRYRDQDLDSNHK